MPKIHYTRFTVTSIPRNFPVVGETAAIDFGLYPLGLVGPGRRASGAPERLTTILFLQHHKQKGANSSGGIKMSNQ